MFCEQTTFLCRAKSSHFLIPRDVWTPVKPMSTMREGVALVTLDSTVYAIGGDNGVSILNTVEKI